MAHDLAQLIHRKDRPGQRFLQDIKNAVAKRAPIDQSPAVRALGEPPSTGSLPSAEQAEPAPNGKRPPNLKARLPRSVRLGKTSNKGRPTTFSWNLPEQANAFLLALGSSGSGKSELLRVIGADLTRQALPVLALDFHGDLAIPGLQRHRLGARLGVNPLALGKLGATETSPRVIIAQLLRQAVPEIGHVQQALLRECVERVLDSAHGRTPTLSDLQAELKLRTASLADRAPSRGLRAALDELFADPVFRAPQSVSLPTLLETGAALDLSGLARPARVVAAGAVLAQLFEMLCAAGPVASRGMLRCFVLLDEAALLRESALVDVLIREARKFGLGMAVATQQLGDLSPSLQANAASAAIFLVQGRAEAVQAARLVRGLHPEELQTLAAPGECFFRDAEGVHRVRITPLPVAEDA
jgi:type IV secretory pathway VirB4 component